MLIVWNLAMTPLLPPQLILWGPPLYSELYVGLCRALAGPWLGDTRSEVGVAPSTAEMRSGGRRARSAWRLIDSRRGDAAPIHATSLVDLHETVRELRRMSDDAIAAEDAAPAVALD